MSSWDNPHTRSRGATVSTQRGSGGINVEDERGRPDIQGTAPSTPKQPDAVAIAGDQSYLFNRPESRRGNNISSSSNRFEHSPSPVQRHRRQRSVLDSLSSIRVDTILQTPPSAKAHSRLASVMPLTGDNRPLPKRQDTSSSELLSRDSKNSPTKATPIITTPSRLGVLASSAVSAFTSRFNSQHDNTNKHRLHDDELFHLNVETALLSASSPQDAEPGSMAAYKNLRMNATNMLFKMQEAYKERTVALHDLQTQREAELEEAAEAKLRIESLKAQLSDMASKAAKQEEHMVDLMSELKAEKRSRLSNGPLMSSGSEGSIMTEDLGVDEDERSKWRKSRETIKSDATFDTDEESAGGDSVFSRSRSPTIMTSATESIMDGPAATTRSNASSTTSLGVPSRPKSTREMTTFQRLMKGISGDAAREEGNEARCANCRGQSSSTAWNKVSELRDENKHLKHHVATLEEAVVGALDIVNGVGSG